MTQRWRYFVLAQKAGFVSFTWDDPAYEDLNMQAALDKAGREGWELVSAFPQPMTGGATLFFKKPD